MDGDIYTSQRCAICGARLVHDSKRDGLLCPEHKEQRATRFFVRFGGGVFKRFKEYSHAAAFLSELRVKSNLGTFNPDDYKAGAPNGFAAQAELYLAEKAHLKDSGKVRLMIRKASGFFHNELVREINRPRIKAYLATLKGSDKTRANYRDALAAFFRWLVAEELIDRVPTIPRIEYELAYRPIVDMEVQARILAKVREQAAPKTALGVEMLATYPAIRPGDLFRIREQDIRLEHSAILIWRPTKKKDGRKVIPLLPEHILAIRELQSRYPGMPEAPFFRHHHDHGGPRLPYNGFGQMVFRKAWDKACASLGIEGVDLYGGTRHSTATALAAEFGRDGARTATQHGTDKAFDRYCQAEHRASLPMAQAVARMRAGKLLEIKGK